MTAVIDREEAVRRWEMCMAEAGYLKKAHETALGGCVAGCRQVQTVDEARATIKAAMLSGVAAIHGCETSREYAERWLHLNPFAGPWYQVRALVDAGEFG